MCTRVISQLQEPFFLDLPLLGAGQQHESVRAESALFLIVQQRVGHRGQRPTVRDRISEDNVIPRSSMSLGRCCDNDVCVSMMRAGMRLSGLSRKQLARES